MDLLDFRTCRVRFEASTGRKDFSRFHREQAMAFKRQLGEAVNTRSGERLSKATIQSTLRDLKAFFEWLSREPGFRSRIAYSNADYFNLSEKDAAIARARREKPVPTPEQVRHVLATMPVTTVLERRDRALIAFAAMTGARVNALASFWLGHVNVAGGFVEQDARAVRTKFAKTFRTYFMPGVEGTAEIVADWTRELREHRLPDGSSSGCPCARHVQPLGKPHRQGCPVLPGLRCGRQAPGPSS